MDEVDLNLFNSAQFSSVQLLSFFNGLTGGPVIIIAAGETPSGCAQAGTATRVPASLMAPSQAEVARIQTPTCVYLGGQPRTLSVSSPGGTRRVFVPNHILSEGGGETDSTGRSSGVIRRGRPI